VHLGYPRDVLTSAFIGFSTSSPYEQSGMQKGGIRAPRLAAQKAEFHSDAPKQPGTEVKEILLPVLQPLSVCRFIAFCTSLIWRQMRLFN
jgi:hypothetical protein